MTEPTTLTYLSADETRTFIDTMVTKGLASTTKHHQHLGAADVWNFTLSNGERFQLWERHRIPTIYSYWKQEVGSKTYETLERAVRSMRTFF